ncbi:hypothetical protein TWF696_002646 [Orbilia brochopaga]|uniref:Uncharacterized protein n=1 Tax=Orbilia brochopaga TaxID=3140254 RepID=A0AAV9U1V6_9PEZI
MAMQQAQQFWQREADSKGPNSDDPAYCYAQAHSAVSRPSTLWARDPIMFCYLGYSIRLSTTRDETMRITCLDAAKIALELAEYVTQPSQTFWGPQPGNLTGKPWEALGTSFWSEDTSWLVYIGKEQPDKDCSKTDLDSRYWPATKPPIRIRPIPPT